MHFDGRSAERLRSFGVVRFAPVADDDYASERVALRTLQGSA